MPTATTLAFADVVTAYNSCVDGDTLSLPAGSVTWGLTDKLTVTKNIRIVGAGMHEAAPVPDPAVATIINLQNTSAFDCTYHLDGSGNPADTVVGVSGIVFVLSAFGSPFVLKFFGKAFMHVVGGLVKGGLRVDHTRWMLNMSAANPPQVASKAQCVDWSVISGNGDSFLTGSFDHNFWDYPPSVVGTNYGGGEINNFSCSGSPDGLDPHAWGQWNWSQDNVWGAGSLNAVYFEDNVLHRAGANLGTTGGGGRLIARYNTTWGGMQGHGMETGNNMGVVSWEWHNNWLDHSNNTSLFAGFTDRGGSSICFNNRFTDYDVAGALNPAIRFELDRVTGTNSGVVGPANGKGFFDRNAKGVITANTASFTPTATVVDNRIGDIYASGNTATISGAAPPNTIYTLGGLSNKGGVVNAWKDFVIINKDLDAPERLGGQGESRNVPLCTTTSGSPTVTCATNQFTADDVGKKLSGAGIPDPSFIGVFNSANSVGLSTRSSSNVPVNATATATLQLVLDAQNTEYFALINTYDPATGNITIYGRNAPDFVLTPTSNWEIRRVLQYFCAPGAGKAPNLLNSGNNFNRVPNTGDPDTTGCAYLAADLNGKHKYWSKNGTNTDGQAAIGSWQWGNLCRSKTKPAWNDVSVVPPAWGGETNVPGGSHDGVVVTNINNNGTAGGAMPTVTANATSLRVGAHWDAPGYTEGLNMGDVGAPTLAYGSPYPGPMLGGTLSGGGIIALSIPAFGAIVSGQTGTQTLTIRNNGDTAFTVTSLSLSPSVYTGTFSGSVAAFSNVTVVITFAPVAVQSYPGTVTVNLSGTVAGTNSIGLTGNGVVGAQAVILRNPKGLRRLIE